MEKRLKEYYILNETSTDQVITLQKQNTGGVFEVITGSQLALANVETKIIFPSDGIYKVFIDGVSAGIIKYYLNLFNSAIAFMSLALCDTQGCLSKKPCTGEEVDVISNAYSKLNLYAANEGPTYDAALLNASALIKQSSIAIWDQIKKLESIAGQSNTAKLLQIELALLYTEIYKKDKTLAAIEDYDALDALYNYDKISVCIGKMGVFPSNLSVFLPGEGNGGTDCCGDGLDSDNQLDGIPNGDGTYTWLKYSAFPNGFEVIDDIETDTVSMSDLPLDVDSLYIGLAYNKTTPVESDDPTEYIWSKMYDRVWNSGTNSWDYTYYDILDENGRATWIKYADTAEPGLTAAQNGMSDNPLGKAWIGFAFDKDPELPESEIFGDYRWSKVLGNDGKDGVPIAGTVQYIWFKYSAFPNGRKDGSLTGAVSMSDDPIGMQYIGIAEGKDTWDESDIPEDYIWSDASTGDVYNASTGTWTWIKYAIDPHSGMSITATIQTRYIGFATGQLMSIADDLLLPDPLSLKYETYQWSSLYMDSNGDVTNYITNNYASTYTWLKFSAWPEGINTDTGAWDITDTVQVDTATIGIGVNKPNPESEDPLSNDPTQYDWTPKGDDIIIEIDGKLYYIWDKYSEYYGGLNNGVADMHDIPTTSDLYIGLSPYQPVKEADDLPHSSLPSSYIWYRINSDIENKNVLYQWVKFATVIAGTEDVDPATMSDEVEAGDTLKGFSFNHELPAIADPNSDDPDFYIWDELSADVQLPNGLWVWDKWSIYNNGRFDELPNGTPSMSDNPTGMPYLGLLIGEDISETEDRAAALAGTAPYTVAGSIARSEIPETYYWGNKFKHDIIPGTFIWIKFAIDEEGSAMSDHPQGKDWMGIGYYKDTYIESTAWRQYFWNRIEALQWYTNLIGKKELTWVQWAAVPSDNIFSDRPQQDTQYMGLAFGKTEEEDIESLDYKDYTWYRFDFQNPGGGTLDDNHQNNFVTELNIPQGTLTSVSEETIAAYLNTVNFVVDQRDNLLITIGDVDERVKGLDYNLPINLYIDENNLPTTTTAGLRWDINGDEGLVRYQVYITPNNGPAYHNTENIKIGLTGLTDGTTYYAYVKGFDIYDNWQASDTIQFDTETVYVDDDPDLYLVTTGRDFIKVRWTIDPAFGATNFKLYIIGGINEYEFNTMVHEGTEKVWEVTDLDENTTYTLYVEAYRGATGPKTSNTVTTTTTLVLDTPTITEVANTLGEDSFTFSIARDITQPVDGYDVFYAIGTAATPNPIWTTRHITGNGLIQTLGGLLPDKNYMIKIQSTAGEVNSLDSNTLYFTTLSDTKAEIQLTKVSIPTVRYTGTQKLRYPGACYTSPNFPLTPIRIGTKLKIYIRFHAKGAIKYDVTYLKEFTASQDYTDVRAFYNAEVVSLGAWGDQWTSSYGFNGSGTAFQVTSHRNGTASRDIMTNIYFEFSGGSVLKVTNGTPNATSEIQIDVTASGGTWFTGFLWGNIPINLEPSVGNATFKKAGVTVTSGVPQTITVGLDGSGEYIDTFTVAQVTTPTTISVKGTLVGGTSSIDVTKASSSVTYNF